LTKIQGKHVVNWLDQTSEEELIAVCSMSDMVISPDTGVLHVAGALKKKAVGVFGNINPATRVSYYPTVKALYPVGKMPCIPCHDVPGACDYDKPGSPCMKLNTPEKIVRAAKELLC
jgi:ADP-heptose:LPS heptosyltransferase